ncbi:hypothetical protein L3Q82_007775 [Scortum barcoo]|uniref:Uncharacterized protein n=1 Tax=Scortum barcoo TaxID=214431 RepID=A0ACB8WN31_9TELE|nr:hypothetical protein L3Q82_007775 [Scortum barcoo]
MAVHQCSPSNLTELERICKEEWQRIPKSRGPSFLPASHCGVSILSLVQRKQQQWLGSRGNCADFFSHVILTTNASHIPGINIIPTEITQLDEPYENIYSAY